MIVDSAERAALIAKLAREKSAFDAVVYTGFADALAELARRRASPTLGKNLQPFLRSGLPEPLRAAPRLVLARQVATATHETRAFLARGDSSPFAPVVLELCADRYTSKNAFKYRLGKMRFFDGEGDLNQRSVYRTVIDLAASEGRPIDTLETLQGARLVGFHHDLLDAAMPAARSPFVDVSKWARGGGRSAKDYYARFLALFVRDGILFENFGAGKSEIDFTRDVVLPAFMQVAEKTGVKPPIVPLLPLERETSEVWSCHSMETLARVEARVFLERRRDSAAVKARIAPVRALAPFFA